MRVPIRREPDYRDLPLPAYATAGAAALDLHAAISADLTLAPGERVTVSTGIRLAVPEGYEAQVRPRSGLARHQGLGLVNAPGTIDSDFRGVVGVVLINWGQEPATIRRGDRIAQLVVAPVVRVEWDDVGDEVLSATPRDEGGFGHTGTAQEGGSHGAAVFS